MPKNRKYLNWLRKEQSNLANGKPSGTMNQGTQTSSPLHSRKDTPSDYLLHRSIKTLPYDNFILILCDGELSSLTIKGDPPIDELVSAWADISDEYTNCLSGGKSNSVFECYKKIVQTDYIIHLLDTCLTYLSISYDKEIAGMIHEYGYDLIEYNGDKADYFRQIETVRMKAKTLIVLLNQYNTEYKLLSPDTVGVEKRTYQDYINDLAILSKFQGYAVRSKDITVSEYVSIVNNFIKVNEKQNV